MNEKRNQLWALGILLFLIIISIVYYQINHYFIYIVAYTWFGVAYGMMLQYGRFCFASASRDLFIAGVPRMAVGVIIALIFFSLVQAILDTLGHTTFHAAPFIGLPMFISGLIFGVGMVLAGGCASGSLYKVGEGNIGNLVAVLFGLCLGQAIFVDLGGVFDKLVPSSWEQSALSKGIPSYIVQDGWFDKYLAGYVWNKPAIRVSDLIGLPEPWNFFIGNFLLVAVIPSLLLLLLIYVKYVRKSFLKKRAKAKGGQTNIKDELAGFWSMITASKRTSLMGVLIGITAGVHIMVMKGLQLKFEVGNFGEILTRLGYIKDVSLVGTVFDPGYWYITTQEAQIGAWFLEKLGWNMHDNIFFAINNGIPNPLLNPALMMSIGIILGAMIMARLNNEFSWKLPKGEMWLWALLGGILMGFGSRPSLGCNIGAFFIRAAGGDPNGWVYAAGMIAGAFIGARFFSWWTERKIQV
ncbi:MAG: YeeE/YedE family protein [Thermodesulfobacteriaceae bacterium]|jgi:uncharacterized membrane protein YedE/YeeE